MKLPDEFGLKAVYLLVVATLLAGCGRKQSGAEAGGESSKPSVPAGGGEPALLVHVGGTMRPAMEEICEMFKKETGVNVELNYGDSGSLITAIATSQRGDVCVVHDPFMAGMEKKGLIDRGYVLASLTPVLAVKKGNPKEVKGIKDLPRVDLKVGLTDAMYSTGGHIVSLVFRKAGITDMMNAKDIVRARGGGEIANAVKVGTIDVGIVWNAVVFARKDALDAVPIETAVMPDSTVDAVTSATYGVIDMSCVKVTLMTLKCSKRLEDARRLAEFAASERGRNVFAARGFSPAPATVSATSEVATP